MMKQLIAFGLTFGLVLSLAACGRGTVENSSAPEKSSAPASSQPLPQSSSEPEPSSAQEVSEQVSTAAVSREQFTYQSGGKDYSVFYPIFSGVANAQLLNDAAKQAAMQLVESSGYQVEMDSATKQPVKVTIETDYELTRQSGNFVSILFVSYFGRSDAAHPNKIVRSVNFNLKTGKVLTVADLLTEDEDLAEVIWEAIRDNVPPEIVDALPAETIWQNINDTAVYMTPDGIGFALPVPYALGDFYQIVVPYWEMQNFLKLDCVATEASGLTAGA